MVLVAGIDSSTQSCKVVVRDAATGALIRHGSAAHPEGTEVDPEAWWQALLTAVEAAGGLGDVSALSVAAQQHGLVALDSAGQVIRPALLWNDLRSADAAEQLITDLGADRADGAENWARAVGLVPTSSFTIAKLRWLADEEPANAARLAAVALPHDWLTWRLAGHQQIAALTTDRSDASGTGYFDSESDTYRRDLLALALTGGNPGARPPSTTGHVVLPRVLGPRESAGRGAKQLGLEGVLLGPGMGDNAGAALALRLRPGDTMVSIGTSGVVGAVSRTRAQDSAGLVSGFADATGQHLNLAVTLNAARVLDATARLLAVDHAELSDLALTARAGSGGLTYIPYLEGERTPNLPYATGVLHGISLDSLRRENLARSTIEGLLCHLADAVDMIRQHGTEVRSISLIGGAARSPAIRELAPRYFGAPVTVPRPSEYVADGAALQAAWVLAGSPEPPRWRLDASATGATTAPVAGDRGPLLRYRRVARHLDDLQRDPSLRPEG